VVLNRYANLSHSRFQTGKNVEELLNNEETSLSPPYDDA
jgi:hypothetical protein